MLTKNGYRIYEKENGDFCRALKNRPAAQACVIKEGQTLRLISYETCVISVAYTSGTMLCYGLYSQTTRQHISAFLKEYFPKISYAELRDNMELNIYDYI